MAKFTKEELDAFDKARADISALPSVYSKLKNHSDSRILAWHINGQRSKGHKQTDEHKQKNREAKIGRKQTDEHKQKNKEAKIGRKHTDEVKQKIGAISRGRKQTDEQKQKNRQAQLGRKHTDESKQNISKTKMKPIQTLYGKFDGRKAAAEAMVKLGMAENFDQARGKIDRLLKTNPTEYYYIAK